MRNGYATFAVGKWHLTPATEMTMGSPRDKWPLGRGFERFYGFMGGETDQFHPELVYDNHHVEPPGHAGGRVPPHRGPGRPGDRCSCSDLRASQPDKPFFLWFTPGRVPCAAPGAGRVHRGLPGAASTRAGTRGATRCSRARSSPGCSRPGTRLSERPSWVPAWDIAHRRRAAPLRPDDGGLRRLPDPHRRAGAARARLHRRARRARRHDRHRDERQRRLRRGRARRARSTSSTSSTSCPRASRRTCAASTTSARRGPTTTTPGAGRGRATRRSSASSATPTRAAWPTRSSCTGRSASAPAARGTSTCTPSTSCRRCSTSSASSRRPSIGGIEQSPIEGVSFAASLTDGDAPSDARHAVLRDARVAGAVPRRLEGGRVPPHAVHRLRRHRREQALRRGRVGAVPRRRGLLRGRRPGRAEPEQLER